MLIFVFVEFLTKVQMKSNELCFIRRNVIYFKHGYMTNKAPRYCGYYVKATAKHCLL